MASSFVLNFSQQRSAIAISNYNKIQVIMQIYQLSKNYLHGYFILQISRTKFSNSIVFFLLA